MASFVEVVRRVTAGPVCRELRSAVLLPFVLQRLALSSAVLFGVQFVPRAFGFTLPKLAMPWVEHWIRWDSKYYLLVAEQGYGSGVFDGIGDAFFPAYPALIRLFSLIMPLPLAAVLVANLSAVVAACALYWIVRTLDGPDAARRSTWISLLFPTAFFLCAAYAESTYLAALCLMTLAWLQRRYAGAFVCATLATVSRPVGGFTSTIPFVIGWLWKSRTLSTVPWFVLGAPLGAAVLGGAHYWSTGNPLGFVASRNVRLLGKSWAYVRSPASWWAVLLDEGLGAPLMRRLLNWSAIGLVGSATVSWARRGEIEFALICLLSLAVPLYFQRSVFDAFGMARYAVVAFPLMIVLARWTPAGWRERGLDLVFAMLQVMLALVFATHRWAE